LTAKQNDLTAKLRGASALFDISGAGVITVNDISAQTANIKEYAAKLQTIKSKVSAALFDEIAGLEMNEGGAYIDQLLQMSDKELKAYSKAYDDQLALTESIAQKTYKKEMQTVENDYVKALKAAYKSLPDEMQTLGEQAMQGFFDGLTKNTDYMSEEIQTYVKAMVDTFKKDLKIASPSKVMMQLGEFTGDGFIEGLKDTIGAVKSVEAEIASGAASPLARGDYSVIRGGLYAGGYAGGNSVVNNYNLVQNNTSPKALSALETYRARRAQIALVKALT
jgi:hypothetical protein